jgi:hypothetical protein
MIGFIYLLIGFIHLWEGGGVIMIAVSCETRMVLIFTSQSSAVRTCHLLSLLGRMMWYVVYGASG